MKRRAIDEEHLAEGLDPEERRRTGAYFTPAALVELLLDRVAALAPPRAALSIVDPACGAGSFLASAARRFPRARLFGLELSPELAAACRERVPSAVIGEGDALRGGLAPLLIQVPEDSFEVWVGNPPYNGTSPALSDPETYQRLRALLPADVRLPRGTSLRDDYAFFLLLAARRLSSRAGALAFVTSATLVDAFLYAPLRRALLDTLSLREVIELGAGVFRGTKVRTCVTVWSSDRQRRQVLHRARAAAGAFEASQLGQASLFHPRPPEWLYRPADDRAERLDERWRAEGEPLTTLVPVSFPGLKTRFDELLVDEDAEALLRRVEAFLRAPADGLADLAAEHGIPERCLGKLEALKRAVPELRAADPSFVRPFFRYAGAKHRGKIPAEARAFCYLDRRLIPRGDHRFRGEYDPHRCPVKLVFNTRELPLAAAMLEEPGCVHDHRHARFAPLWVPQRIRDEGLGVTRSGAELGPDVPNLSPRGLEWAATVGSPQALFRELVAFINSPEVQATWAPAFGASRELYVPLPKGSTASGEET